MEETKLVRIRVDDWDTLNRYLSILQIRRGKALSFPDVLHEVIETHIKIEVEEAKKKLGK